MMILIDKIHLFKQFPMRTFASSNFIRECHRGLELILEHEMKFCLLDKRVNTNIEKPRYANYYSYFLSIVGHFSQ